MDNSNEPVIINLNKNDIDKYNTQSIINILNSFIPTLTERNRNRVRIQIYGYDNDSRELYDIKEIRVFFHKLFDEEPGLFYWFDLKSYMFVFFGLMLFKPDRHKGKVSLSPQDLQKYLTYGFMGLNKFCNKHNLSSEPTNNLIKGIL